MSFENVTAALQVNATTGNGLTLTLPEARFVTFKIQGNGPVAAGQVTIECCPPLPRSITKLWTIGVQLFFGNFVLPFP
jgi:hypothetical protein